MTDIHAEADAIVHSAIKAHRAEIEVKATYHALLLIQQTDTGVDFQIAGVFTTEELAQKAATALREVVEGGVLMQPVGLDPDLSSVMGQLQRDHEGLWKDHP